MSDNTNLTEEERRERRRRALRKKKELERRRRARRNRLIVIIALLLIAALALGLFIRHIKKGKTAQPASAAVTDTAETGDPSIDDGADPTGTPAADTASAADNTGADTADTGNDGTAESAEPAGETSGEALAETAQAASAPETVYATAILNVREQPNTDCAVLGQIQQGDSIERLSDANGWSTISFNGATAYVSSEFLTTEKPQRPVWDIGALDPTSYNFGYSKENRDERNIPTDWKYYEDRWGEFDVDWIGDTSKNVIYLTMDEGFGNETTIPILNTLAEKNVPVTFFITKYFADERPDLVQAILDHGHQIGNHSCTHPDMTSLSIEEQTAQMMDLNNQIKEQFGYEMKAFRYPMGIYSAQSLGLANNLGFKVTFWSYAYGDYDNDHQPDVGTSLQAALDAVHPGAIYLLHASSTTNAAMLADFIDGVRARGFEFGVYPIE